MNKLYFTKAEGIYDRLDGILKEFLGYSPQILRTENGKIGRASCRERV